MICDHPLTLQRQPVNLPVPLRWCSACGAIAIPRDAGRLWPVEEEGLAGLSWLPPMRDILEPR